jgi:hypothetical protein
MTNFIPTLPSFDPSVTFLENTIDAPPRPDSEAILIDHDNNFCPGTLAVTELSSPASGISAVRQLVFIDRDVPDLVQLTSGLAAGTRAVLLDDKCNALGQIAEALDRHGPVEAVHIVAHGSPGELHFSSGTVSRASLAHDATVLARIGAALAPHADVLLWACEAGRGEKGEKFLDALAAATSANVAAATHPVGSAPLGGSWDLDAMVGAVAAGIPFAAAQNFTGLLSAPVLSNVAGTVSTRRTRRARCWRLG